MPPWARPTPADDHRWIRDGAIVVPEELLDLLPGGYKGFCWSILWVEADPQALPTELRRGRFDLVYAGSGGLDGLADLDGWARGIASALRTRGELLVFDEHPAAVRVDALMRWHHDYFAGPPRLGQLVTALAGAGLVTRALEEYPSPPGNPRRHDRRIPGEFLLYADKEAR